jgi:hypothetical protein
MRLIAIDPGLKGGYALFEDGGLMEWGPLPVWKTSLSLTGKPRKQVDVLELKKLAMAYEAYAVVTEYQTPMPGQSSVATATSFLNYGLVLSLRSLASIHVVHPRVWKKALDLGPHKAAAIYHARLLYPGLKDEPLADGPAEAVLIGHYWITQGADIERAHTVNAERAREKRAVARLARTRRRRLKGAKAARHRAKPAGPPASDAGRGDT